MKNEEAAAWRLFQIDARDAEDAFEVVIVEKADLDGAFAPGW